MTMLLDRFALRWNARLAEGQNPTQQRWGDAKFTLLQGEL